MPLCYDSPMKRTLLILPMLAAAALAIGRETSTPAGSTTGSQPSQAKVALPEEDPNFIALMEKLSERATLYRKHALGFSCREVASVTKYEVDTSSYRKSNKTMYDYLFEEKPDGTLREVREELIPDKEGFKRRSTDFDPSVPPAYAWASLFAKENRSRFHFRPAGQVVKAYRLLTVITFIGTSPNPGGEDIAGWSGQVWVENRSNNLWSVEAVPTGQDVRLDAEVLRYRKAFAIMGVPLASRPHGWVLNVGFGIEVQGLSYPTEQELKMSSLSPDNKMNVEEKTTFRYENYRFFGVETESEIKGAAEQEPEKVP